MPPGFYSVIFQRTSEYEIFRRDGTRVGNSFKVLSDDFVQKMFDTQN